MPVQTNPAIDTISDQILAKLLERLSTNVDFSPASLHALQDLATGRRFDDVEAVKRAIQASEEPPDEAR